MFYNPFAGFRDPNDPFGLMRQAAASAVPEIAPRPVATTRYGPDGQPLPPDAPSPALGFPPSPPSPMRTDASSPLAPGVTDERLVPLPLPPTSRKIPEVVTTPTAPDERLVPTAASQAPPVKSYYDKLMDMYKDPKFGPALAALTKGMGQGAGAPPAPRPIHFETRAAPQPYVPQGAEAMMKEIRNNLTKFAAKPRKPRQDDPHDREQDTYDFRRLKRSM